MTDKSPTIISIKELRRMQNGITMRSKPEDQREIIFRLIQAMMHMVQYCEDMSRDCAEMQHTVDRLVRRQSALAAIVLPQVNQED